MDLLACEGDIVQLRSNVGELAESVEDGLILTLKGAEICHADFLF